MAIFIHESGKKVIYDSWHNKQHPNRKCQCENCSQSVKSAQTLTKRPPPAAYLHGICCDVLRTHQDSAFLLHLVVERHQKANEDNISRSSEVSRISHHVRTDDVQLNTVWWCHFLITDDIDADTLIDSLITDRNIFDVKIPRRNDSMATCQWTKHHDIRNHSMLCLRFLAHKMRSKYMWSGSNFQVTKC